MSSKFRISSLLILTAGICIVLSLIAREYGTPIVEDVGYEVTVELANDSQRCVTSCLLINENDLSRILDALQCARDFEQGICSDLDLSSSDLDVIKSRKMFSGASSKIRLPATRTITPLLKNELQYEHPFDCLIIEVEIAGRFCGAWIKRRHDWETENRIHIDPTKKFEKVVSNVVEEDETSPPLQNTRKLVSTGTILQRFCRRAFGVDESPYQIRDPLTPIPDNARVYDWSHNGEYRFRSSKAALGSVTCYDVIVDSRKLQTIPKGVPDWFVLRLFLESDGQTIVIDDFKVHADGCQMLDALSEKESCELPISILNCRYSLNRGQRKGTAEKGDAAH